MLGIAFFTTFHFGLALNCKLPWCKSTTASSGRRETSRNEKLWNETINLEPMDVKLTSKYTLSRFLLQNFESMNRSRWIDTLADF